MIVSTTQETLINSSQSLSQNNRHIEPKYGTIGGTLKFEDSLINEARPFLYVDENMNLRALQEFMTNEWKLKPPKIVIPVLSGITNHKPFKNPKMIESFKNGIKNAANASEVWFITNGLDAGMPQLIGAAFHDEKNRRRADVAWAKQMGRDPKECKPLVLIGIVCDHDIKDTVDLITVPGESKIDVRVPTCKDDQLSLNKDHTHFIIIREQPIGLSTRKNTEEKLTDSAQSATNRFRDRFEEFLYREALQNPSPETTTTTDAISAATNPQGEDGFPMVCTLVRGTPGTIELLYQKIQQEIPVVILKGTGSAADLVAFVYEEINAKNDIEHENNYLKVEIARRLLDEYPVLKDNNVKRNEIRDHILFLAKKAGQGKQKFLTFLDVNSTTPSLNDFHQFILSALLQSQEIVSGTTINTHLKRHLLLTLDWNLPKLARSEIFQRDDMKYPIHDDLFDKAILEKKLEPFVDLFLDQEFVLHRYLKSDKLLSLFNKAEEREFLTTTSLEGILGLTGDDPEVPKEFVEHDLNIIMERLTGMTHFFSEDEMDRDISTVDIGEKSDYDIEQQKMMADKKALRHLITYAVLMHRQELAKVLWKHSSEPIPLALICCMIYKRLAPYCYEPYQRSLIEKSAKEFSDYAVGVLDKAFSEDDARACDMLDERHSNWNHVTTIELAYNTKNKEFMAHAACQKWVTRKFYGDITPRELSWGIFKCPDYLKIIFSAILIFPMRSWINFSPIGQASLLSKKATSSSNDQNDTVESETQLEEGTPLAKRGTQASIREPRNIFQRIGHYFRQKRSKNRKSVGPPATSNEKAMSTSEKIKILWTAPITKFYTNFVAYIVFLVFFTLAVMWPSCGNLILDCFVWFWTASIAFENARVAYEKHFSQSNLPLRQIVTEVIVQTIFLVLYFVVKIVGLWKFGTCRILAAKAIMGIGLIYYYYRILWSFFPASSKLGPMMIRLRYMVTHDFFTFLQLFVIFMISSGVAITAVLYPHYPLGLDLFGKAFVFRGLMALFSSDMTDIKSQRRSCTINATNLIDSNNIHGYNRYGISSPRCNQTSWIAWFLLIQYFFLAKRFLTSLLTAMFSVTGARVQSQSEQIWMYNRYEIVMEYAKRPRLPPPFVVISYISMLIAKCSRLCVSKSKDFVDKKSNSSIRSRSMMNNHRNDDLNPALVTRVVSIPNNNSTIVYDTSTDINKSRSSFGCLLSCIPCKQVTNAQNEKNELVKRNWEDSEVSLYWKYKAKEYSEKTQEPDKTQEKLDNLSNDMTNSRKDIDGLRKSLREVNDRVVTLEKLMIDSHILLEKIQATILQEDKSLLESLKFIHILARKSPYVYTNEARFPVTERYVSWRIPYDLYDPTVITLSKEHVCFRDDERPFVEQDLLKTNFDKKDNDQSGTLINLLPIPSTSLPKTGIFPLLEPSVSITTSQFAALPLDFKWNQKMEYQLPDGKKMTLDRTTWVRKEGEQTSIYKLDIQLHIPLNPMGRTGVRGRGALIRWGPNKSIVPIITRWKKQQGQFTIINGQRILEALGLKGEHTHDWKLPGGKILGVESPYRTICRSFNKLFLQDDDTEYSLCLQERDMIEHFQAFARSNDQFEYHMAYQGYIDDTRNTDNAWVEAEIWNFHYGSTMSLSNDIASWKAVTHNTRGFRMQKSILREIAQKHDAFFE